MLHTSLLHFGVAGGQSLLPMHCTQVLASLHKGAAGEVQLAFVLHSTHWLSLPQIGVEPEQFCGPRHCTQRELATSHFGVLPPHCTSLVQPERHF
jgi:hypothetical protein